MSHFDNSSNTSDFFIIFIFIVVICDQSSLMVKLLTLFNNKIFLIKVCTLFFRHNVTEHLIDYNVNRISICTETKKIV